MEATKTESTIQKTTVECYKIRFPGNYMWADINIDDNGTAGRIQIASDYGSWQYFWGSCGSGFKKFLCELDIHYVAGKFGCDRHFDVDATIKGLKQRVKEYTDDKSLRKVLREEIDSLQDDIREPDFVRNVSDCDEIMIMEDHMPSLCYDLDPGFRKFWEKVWPVFTEELEKEINQIATY